MDKDKPDGLELDDVSRSGVTMKVWRWDGYPAFAIDQGGRPYVHGCFVPTGKGIKKLRKFLKNFLGETPKEG